MVAAVAELLTVRIMVEAAAREYLDRARTVLVVPHHLVDTTMAMVVAVLHVAAAPMADIPAEVALVPAQVAAVEDWPISTTIQ
jgi:hypothetical protein